jgi:hypothetical protein
MKYYAVVEFETADVGRYGKLRNIGYVTESIKKTNSFKNKRVRVYGSDHGKSWTKYIRRKNILSIIPLC